MVPPARIALGISPARLSAACIAVAFVLAGCGGSSASSASNIKARCQATQTAAVEYQEAVKELNFNFKEHLKVATVLATTLALRGDLSALAGAEQGTARQQLTAFAGALGRQEQIVKGVVAGNTASVAPLAKGLNTELPAGFANLSRICAKA
jgi:hypothetical protein